MCFISLQGGAQSSKSRKSKSSGHKQKVVVGLYNKVCDIVSSVSELLEIQLLTDTTILQVRDLSIKKTFLLKPSSLTGLFLVFPFDL